MDSDYRPTRPDHCLEQAQERWTNQLPQQTIPLCIRLGGMVLSEGQGNRTTEAEERSNAPEPLQLATLTKIAQQITRPRHESHTFQYIPSPGQTYTE